MLPYGGQDLSAGRIFFDIDTFASLRSRSSWRGGNLHCDEKAKTCNEKENAASNGSEASSDRRAFSSISRVKAYQERAQRKRTFTPTAFATQRVIPPSNGARVTPGTFYEAYSRGDDYYTLLSLERSGATLSSIKRAYRAFARQLHPDRSGGATEDAFQALRDVYSVLSDAKKRNEYDLRLQLEETFA